MSCTVLILQLEHPPCRIYASLGPNKASRGGRVLPPAALNLQEPATRDSLTALSSDDVVASQARMLEANLELPESSAGKF